MRNELTKVARQKSGMRSNVMPGARSRIMVMMKLTAPATEETPSRLMATIQTLTPSCGEKARSVSGA